MEVLVLPFEAVDKKKKWLQEGSPSSKIALSFPLVCRYLIEVLVFCLLLLFFFYTRALFKTCTANFKKSCLTFFYHVWPVCAACLSDRCWRSLGATVLLQWSEACAHTSLLALIYSTFISISLCFCLKFVFSKYVFFWMYGIKISY